MTLQYGLHCGACELELRFMFNTQSCANDSFPAAIREGEIAFESRNLFCVICVVHRLPQFSCGGVSSLALGQVLVVDGIIQMVPYAHVYIYFRKVQGFIVMCVIKFQRRDGLKMKSQRSKKQYVMCGTTFTMINSSSKVGGINEMSLSPPNQLVKRLDKLGPAYYKIFENIDGAECKQRERWVREEDDIACRNVHVWFLLGPS